MENNHSKKKKRFWWIFASVVILTTSVSSIFFFQFFGIGFDSFTRTDTAGSVVQKDLSAEEEEKIKEVRSTVGESYQDLGAFISSKHEFYNQTTGYGGIGNLDWDEQRNKAEEIIHEIEELISDVSDESLQTDLDSILTLSNQVLNEEETEHIRLLHRYFHDLDIALNHYTTYDRIWNVTETLEGLQ